MKGKKLTYTSLCTAVVSSSLLLGGCVPMSEPFDMTIKKLSKNLNTEAEEFLGADDFFDEDDFEIKKKLATFEADDDLYIEAELTRDGKIRSVTVRMDDVDEEDLGDGFVNLASVTMAALDDELDTEELVENVYYLVNMNVEQLFETFDSDGIYSYDEDKELIRNEIRYELTLDDDDTLRLTATKTKESDTKGVEKFKNIIQDNLDVGEFGEALEGFLEETFGEDTTATEIYSDGNGAGAMVVDTNDKEEETSSNISNNVNSNSSSNSSSASTSSKVEKSSPSNPGRVGDTVLATIKNYKTGKYADVEVTLNKIVRGDEAIKMVDKYNAQDNASEIDYSSLEPGETELMVFEYTVEVVSDEPSDSYFTTYSAYLKDLDGESSAEGNGYSFWMGAWSIDDTSNYPNLKVGQPATYRKVMTVPVGLDDYLIRLECYENEVDAFFSLK